MKDLEREAYEYVNARPNELHEAMVTVMKAVKNIDKSMTVGSGSYAYKGISDKDVKFIIGNAMAEAGITCVPVDYDVKTQIDRWVESGKQKQSVFTEVNAKYLITHSESGQSQIIAGYGHGVDSQDKSAGKATTYALKNALLYAFLVPTGQIDDTDNTHSEQIETPKPQRTDKQMMLPSIDDVTFKSLVDAIGTKSNKWGCIITKEEILKRFVLTTTQEGMLNLIEGTKK